jgi:hypothetical protein
MSNNQDQHMSNFDPDLVERYESLRQQVQIYQGDEGMPRQGLNVLLQRGMISWMRAWSLCKPTCGSEYSDNMAVSSNPEEPISIPEGLCSNAVMLLTSMALSHHQSNEKRETSTYV